MFNIGDEVIMVHSSTITKEGDIGFVVRKGPYNITVKFHSMQKKQYIGEKFTLPLSWIELLEGNASPIERKIKRMYERQSYFLRHRSGQPA